MKSNNLIKFYLTAILGVLVNFSSTAQGISVNYDLYSMAEKNQFEVHNRKIIPFAEQDKRGIRFSKSENDGVAFLEHVIFSNGTIDVDIRGKDVLQESFVGIAFHGTNDKTMDVIYFRPFNFQVPDTVRKAHAVQYVSLPEYSWELLRDKFNGKYEKPINPAPDGNEWFHVRIIVKSPNVTVFVNGNERSCLSIEKLNNRASGRIGLWVGNNSEGDFANLKVSSYTSQ